MYLDSIISFVICLVACFAAGIIGSLFTMKAIPVWYASLKKPLYTPPQRVFGPVWITLYIMMATSVFLVWEQGLRNTWVLPAYVIFWIQLIFNALWSVVFFGMKRQGWAVAIIVVLWFFILITIISFFRISAWAGILLVPYIMWVTVASYLNIGIWRLNRKI